MKKLRFEDLYNNLGATIIKDIYCNGQILIKAPCEINNEVINLIKEKQKYIFYIFISTNDTKDIKMENIIQEEINTIIRLSINDILKNYSYNYESDEKIIHRIINLFFDRIIKENFFLNYLENLLIIDKNTFTHVIRVSVISILLSVKAGYTIDMIEDIGKGAILHDIGKIKLFSKYPNLCDPYHSYSFDEYEIFKMHPYIGYENVENNKEISLISKKIILLHHVWENFNSSYSKEKHTYLSYPIYFRNKLIKKEMKDESVSIVQVANFYDNVINNFRHINVNRFSLFNYIKENGINIFGKYATNLLLTYISVYKIGDKVELNNNEKGIIIKHTNDVNTPIIELINGEKIDLSSNKKYKITNIIEEDNKGVKINELRKDYYYL